MKLQLHALALVLSLFFHVSAGQDVRRLEAGKAVEREIAGGQSHTYQIQLAAGQFVRVVVEQKAIDVALVLAAPDGKQVVEVNITGPAMKSLSAEAEASGDYRLTARALGAGTPAQSYLLRLEVRAPTAGDKQRIAAERLLAEADQLFMQGPAAARQTLEKSEQSLALWRALGDRYWQAQTLNLMGRASGSMRSFEKAVEHFDQALHIMREIRDRRGEGQTLSNLGLAYSPLGRQEKAIEHHEQALAIRRELKDRAAEGNTLGHLGAAYFRLSSYDKAIEYFEQSLAIKRELKDHLGEGHAFNNIANAYSLLGRQEKAIEYYEQALAAKRELKDRQGEGSSLGNLGNAYWFLGRYDKAVEYYELALVILREFKDRVGEGHMLSNLGLAYDSLGRHEEAIKRHEQALPILREVKDRIGEGLALEYMGNSYRGLGRQEKAIECLEQALSIARDVKNRDNETSALYNFAKVERDRGDLARARNFIEEGLKVAESLRSDIYNQGSRAAYFALMQKYSGFYIDLLMRLHRASPARGFDALAIESSERARARGLLELLTEIGSDIRQGVETSLLERERALAKQLNAKAASQMQLLSRQHTPEQAAVLKQEISQLETEYERAQAAIRKASPHYAALTQPQPLKLREIQAQLDADTLLLEYALGEERSYLWAISKDSLTSYELPKEELIKQSALQVHELLSARSTSKRGESALQRQQRVNQAEAQLPAVAQALSQTILAPVAAQLGNKQLVVVADGALQYIPFAMLPHPAAGKGEPLVVRHEVVSLPSASALAIQRAERGGRQPAPKMLAVIADPVFDRSDARFTTPATETNEKQQAQTIASDDARSIEHFAAKSDDKSGVTTRRLVIPRLPFTRQEATRLLALTPKNSSFSAIDFQASRATVLKGDLAQYRYVHFATHGLLDSERPGLSSLVLSMVDAKGNPQDGFLRANDIYNLKLPAELVVLSACQTGLGKEIKGEGLVGLTRGFMYAGAARVVVSLWSVNDKATADLMAKFYQKMLKQGERPAAALRAAQVEMWKQKQWQSPYYWAAFTLQGEWR